MISQSNGEALISELLENETINASLIDNSTYLDSDYDTEIIAHEYGHGISNRLMGGAQSSGCMQNLEQQGEGFSDWFGLMLTMRESDSPSIPRGVATYSSGQEITGDGLRNAPYSPDFSVNDYTYADSNNTATVSQPHGVGFVFATMLWDLTWAFVDEYGFDPDITNGNGGNNKVMQLIIDGLKVAPCSSGFADMRDAIILADQLTNNGVNKCLIWNVFANRGLGYLAEQGDEDSRTDQVEDFTLPPTCQSSSNNFDSGVLSINSPNSGVLTNNETITVSVRNYGVNSISDFDIYFQVNENDQIIERANSESEKMIISINEKFFTLSENKKKSAEQKIEQIKKNAIKDIKDASIKIAIESTSKIIETSIEKSKLEALFKQNLEQIKISLNKNSIT